MNELELAGHLEAMHVQLLGWDGAGTDTAVCGRLVYLYVYCLCECVENHLVVSLGLLLVSRISSWGGYLGIAQGRERTTWSPPAPLHPSPLPLTNNGLSNQTAAPSLPLPK